MEAGVVFNIQRYSIHDGPGIRTTVFLKGCPLRCIWCCNPESQRSTPEIGRYPAHCIRCGACVASCRLGSIEITRAGAVVDWDRCDRCGLCAEECLAGGIERIGRNVSVDDVVSEVERDRFYYALSGGGVTLSGGEPTMQPGFARALLVALKERGFHTAMETCGHTTWDVLSSLLPHLDLVLYDLKQIDPDRHRLLTGFSNEVILENARLVAKSGVQMIARAPVIPGCNDDEVSIRELIAFVTSLGSVEELHFLPYHRLGVGKAAALGRRASFDAMSDVSPDPLSWALDAAAEMSLKAQLGG